MKFFHCDNCGQPIFFEKTQCVKCKHTLGYLPDKGRLSALTAARSDSWTSVESQVQSRVYRMCQNYSEAQVCNWMVPANDVEPIASAEQLDMNLAPDDAFSRLVSEWLPLTFAFNSINRSMGLEDLYPFVLSSSVIDKLRFVHQIIVQARY